jgi:hypothetical protein
MGASKPEIVAGNGLLRSSIVFETIPVCQGSAPVASVTWDTAVSAGVGGCARSANNPRSASRA